ncbi:unnamed protein product, partial [Brassica rapa]
ARRALFVVSSFGDREKRRFEVFQKAISPSPVSFWPVILRRCSSSSQSKSQRPRLTSRLVLK